MKESNGRLHRGEKIRSGLSLPKGSKRLECRVFRASASGTVSMVLGRYFRFGYLGYGIPATGATQGY